MRKNAKKVGKKMILLVIDIQKGITDEGLYAFGSFIENVQKIIEIARKNDIEIIYFQHDDGPGTGFSIGDTDFEIAKQVEPKKGEKVFVKDINSCFGNKEFTGYLDSINEKELMIVGLQTNYCIDATIRTAFDRGYHVIIPEGTNSTFDNDYMNAETTYKYYNEMMWPERYAQCVTMDEALKRLNESKTKKPFWEEEYLDLEKSTFGEPSKEVVDIARLLKKGAKILDVGCGDGRHALYFAGLGFQVDAFDISPNAISKIDYLKKKHNLNVNTYVCDVFGFEFKCKYDLVIMHGVLQFVERDKQPEMINLLKKHTEKNGYHIVALFTDAEPVPEDLKDVMVGVFKEGEIKDYYSDWNIKMFESKKFSDEHENGVKHCHAMNKIIAMK